MARIHRNYRFIVSFNFSLIVLGVLGILPPTTMPKNTHMLVEKPAT